MRSNSVAVGFGGHALPLRAAPGSSYNVKIKNTTSRVNLTFATDDGSRQGKVLIVLVSDDGLARTSAAVTFKLSTSLDKPWEQGAISAVRRAAVG